MSIINIEGINKARLLQALFNHSHQQGLGLLDESGAVDMTIEDAQSIVQKFVNSQDRWPLTFDYLRGRVMKVNIDGDEFDSKRYDRDVGEGAAEAVVAAIREDMEAEENAAAIREDMEAEENAAAMEEAEKDDALNHTPVDPSPLDEVVDEPFDPLNESDKGVFLS